MPEYTRREWIDIIHRAIMDEMSDSAYYQQMAATAPDYEAREMIRSMADDEARHAQMLTEVYTAMTGRQPSPMQHSPMVAPYGEALEHRFHAETKDFKKYKEYYLSTDNMRLRDVFFDIMHDEAAHAMYLQYLMHKHCCAMMHPDDHECDYQHKPGYDCKPGYDYQPDYGYKPGYDYKPDYDYGPDHEHQPDYGKKPDYEYEPDYDEQPDYEEKPDQECDADEYYKPPSYKYPRYK